MPDQMEAERKQFEQTVRALTAEGHGLREQVAELQAKLDRCQKALSELNANNSQGPTKPPGEQHALSAERDAYLESLYALTRKEFTFAADELSALESGGLTLDQVLEELERPRGT
jgi:septal ring factor EnvC (AmiA/AmiB activator)